MRGGGFTYPIWNIQGYHFLDLRRSARFENAVIPVRILLTEGRVTAPGRSSIGRPEVRDQIIFISHPDVKNQGMEHE